MNKTYKKEKARMIVKFVKKETNEIIHKLPTDTMEMYQYFSNNFIDQIMKKKFGEKELDKIGDIMIVIDSTFTYD